MSTPIALTPVYTVSSPNNTDYEVWTAPARPGQMPRRAVVRFPQTTNPASAHVDLYRVDPQTGEYIQTGGRANVPLQAARFMARCHVEWPHPDDAGSVVVFASN